MALIPTETTQLCGYRKLRVTSRSAAPSSAVRSWQAAVILFLKTLFLLFRVSQDLRRKWRRLTRPSAICGLFWIALGTTSGWLYRRLAGSANSC